MNQSFVKASAWLNSLIILNNITLFADISGRGDGKFGDKCQTTNFCGVYWGVCDTVLHTCQCLPEYPITNHYDKCGKRKYTKAYLSFYNYRQVLPPYYLFIYSLTCSIK